MSYSKVYGRPIYKHGRLERLGPMEQCQGAAVGMADRMAGRSVGRTIYAFPQQNNKARQAITLNAEKWRLLAISNSWFSNQCTLRYQLIENICLWPNNLETQSQFPDCELRTAWQPAACLPSSLVSVGESQKKREMEREMWQRLRQEQKPKSKSKGEKWKENKEKP